MAKMRWFRVFRGVAVGVAAWGLAIAAPSGASAQGASGPPPADQTPTPALSEIVEQDVRSLYMRRQRDEQAKAAATDPKLVEIPFASAKPPSDTYTNASVPFLAIANMYAEAARLYSEEVKRILSDPETSPDAPDKRTALKKRREKLEAARKKFEENIQTFGDTVVVRLINEDPDQIAHVLIGKPPKKGQPRKQPRTIGKLDPNKPDDNKLNLTVKDLRADADENGVVDIYIAYAGNTTTGPTEYELHLALERKRFKPARIDTTVTTTPSTSASGAATTTAISHQSVNVRIDRAGIATPQFLNPRDPRYLFGDTGIPDEPFPGESEKDWRARWLKHLRDVNFQLKFDTNESDVTFIVKIGGINEEFRSRFEAANAPLENCAKRICEAKVYVSLGAPGRLPGDLLYEALLDKFGFGTLAKFTAAAFEDARELSRPTGYFTIVDRHRYLEPESSTRWGLNASTKLAFEPDIDALKPGKDIDAVLTDVRPLGSGEQLQHFTGESRLRLRQTLNTRAVADVELLAKSGDFGGAATTRSVSLSQYRVEMFGTTGFSLSFGRFDVALPSDGIAIRETGDAVSVTTPGQFTLSHIIRRESLNQKADDADRDDWSFVAQLKEPFFLPWRSAFYAVYGDEDKPEDPHRYFTIGGEGFFDVPSAHLQQSLALYASHRRPGSCGSTCKEFKVEDADNVTGGVGLYKISWTKVRETAGFDLPDNYDPVIKALVARRTSLKQAPKAAFVIGGSVGLGSADDPDSPEDEGYLGETAGFKPDGLFLSKFAGITRTGVVPTKKEKVDANCTGSACEMKDVPDPPKTERNGRGQVGPGLANKWFVSGFYTDRRFSLLDPIRLMVKSKESALRTTTGRVHWYRFREKVFDDHAAGVAVELESQMEAPRGIRNTLTAGHFWRGKALTSLLHARSWYVSVGVTLDIK